MGKLIDSMTRAANSGREGSGATRAARKSHIRDLADYLQSANIQVKDARHISPRHIAGYVAHLQAAGKSAGSIQNRIATVRAVWRGAGCDRWASKSNTELGAASRSRIGSKTAMGDERYAQARADLAASGRAREAAALALQRVLGLRAQEAVRSPTSLATWQRDLERGERIRIIAGTKGGRPRDTRVPDRQAALAAVREARALAGRGHLVQGRGGTLKSALDRLHNSYRAVGLAGPEASHSARYAFAQEAMARYRSEGYSEREARAQASLDLGHGDGRGRYVASVYGR
jgi:site-specific recombinase XerD